MFSFSFRGFGFITFEDSTGVDKVLAHGTHELDGKKVSIFFACIKLKFVEGINFFHFKY